MRLSLIEVAQEVNSFLRSSLISGDHAVRSKNTKNPHQPRQLVRLGDGECCLSLDALAFPWRIKSGNKPSQSREGTNSVKMVWATYNPLSKAEPDARQELILDLPVRWRRCCPVRNR